MSFTRIALALFAGSQLAACTIGSGSGEPLSYEEFVEQNIGVTRDASGRESLYYDWDQPLSGWDQVQAMYQEYRRVKEGGEVLSAAVVNETLFGGIDVWPAGTRSSLTYCVSNAFGDRKAAVVDALARATADWQAASNGGLRFAYVPGQDGNCTSSNTAVTFNTIPINESSGLIASAFFPSYARADRQLKINMPQAFAANPSYPLVGILRHELGHAIGLRHETTRIDAVIEYGRHCFENVFFEELTDYDDLSVMVTPACVGNAIKNKQLVISALDAVGVQELYGP